MKFANTVEHLTEPGKNSPYRDRSIEENLDLFEKMRNGEFENGEKVLRAKIDMSSPNINFVILLFTVLHMRPIITQAINGAFIRCMPLLIHSKMRLKG